MAQPTVVHSATATSKKNNNFQKVTKEPSTSWGSKDRHKRDSSVSFPNLLKHNLKEKGYSNTTVQIISMAWRNTTQKTYSTYVLRWVQYCNSKHINISCPTIPQFCEFLIDQKEKFNLGYSALNTCRSAISSIAEKVENFNLGQHPIVCALLKGMYHMNPPKARYAVYWDVNVILKLFQSWGPNSNLSLKYLSYKVSVLLLLVTSARGQMIVHLPVDSMQCTNNIVFRMQDLLKHNHPGDALDTVVLFPFDEDENICIVRAVKCYLKMTENLRKNSKYLLISDQKPHNDISGETLSRWTKQVFMFAGIDIAKYSRHSVRGASTSKAKSLGISVSNIMKHARWRSAESFAKHYDKKVQETDVAQIILENAVKKNVALKLRKN